eukprot:754495-Pyramimonas_sp.AAC.1
MRSAGSNGRGTFEPITWSSTPWKAGGSGFNLVEFPPKTLRMRASWCTQMAARVPGRAQQLLGASRRLCARGPMQ